MWRGILELRPSLRVPSPDLAQTLAGIRRAQHKWLVIAPVNREQMKCKQQTELEGIVCLLINNYPDTSNDVYIYRILTLVGHGTEFLRFYNINISPLY